MVSQVRIMATVNLNDDSFFAGSRHSGDDIVPVVSEMLEEGADIIDFGACSTRPGSEYIEEDAEWARLEPALESVAVHFPDLKLSVDTFRSGIVRRAFNVVGHFTVNDISAGEEDADMLQTVAELGLGYVAMHKRGNPSTMQGLCDYGAEGVVTAIDRYFEDFSRRAAEAGLNDWILDPGLGFAKTVGQNWELVDSLCAFKHFGKPILVGLSRKSFIYKPLGLTAETCLDEVCKAHERAVLSGADILRVHDVAAARKVLSSLEIF